MQTFTEDEIAALAEQVEARLWQISAGQVSLDSFGQVRGGAPQSDQPLSEEEKSIIETATGKSFQTFWAELKPQIRQSLCQEDGALRKRWEEWQKLTPTDTLKNCLLWLGALGVVPQASLAVAVTVIVMVWVGQRGIKAFCQECDKT